MSTADKLNKLLETKQAIRQAIIDKGVEVADDTIFADYPAKISAIESGSSTSYYENLFNIITNNNTDYQYLFYGYTGTEIDLSDFDTSNVIDMSAMFWFCSNLTSLDLSSFDTSNVIDMCRMFSGCKKLTTLTFGDKFVTSNVTDMDSMFYGCDSLLALDLSSFDTSNVTNTSYMFHNCTNLTTLDIRNFDMTNVTDTYTTWMFYGCKALRVLRLDNCNNNTISKIINSSNFPTNDLGVPRYIYCSREAAADIALPDEGGWAFKY